MDFRLKSLRKKHRMSQTYLAMELGVSQNSISRFETGERRPDYDLLITIADYFKVSIDYLVGRTDNPDINR